MSFQEFREFPGYHRSRAQRFLTPRGWAVRLPDGRILYEGSMGRQRRVPNGFPASSLGSIGGYPPPTQFPGQFPMPSMNGFPGQFPSQSAQFPGHFFGQFPTQPSGQFPDMMISQSPGLFPGMFMNPGPVPGQFIPLQPDGGWPAPCGPKHRQRFRTSPVRVRPADMKEDETECPICYRDYYTGDVQNEAEDAVRIPCGHVYGRRCLDIWIQENDTCPTCRGRLDLVDDVAGG